MAVFEEALKYFPSISDGITYCPVKGVHYFKESFSKDAEPSVYPAGLCIMFSGSKILTMDDICFKYTGGEYVVCSMTMPLNCEICANKDEPVKGIFIGFTINEIREIVEEMGLMDSFQKNDLVFFCGCPDAFTGYGSDQKMVRQAGFQQHRNSFCSSVDPGF